MKSSRISTMARRWEVFKCIFEYLFLILYSNSFQFEIMRAIRCDLLTLILSHKTPVRREMPFNHMKWNIDQCYNVVSHPGLFDDGLLCPIKEPIISWRAHESEKELREHAIEMQNTSNGMARNVRAEPICRFCNFVWDSVHSLQLHLITARHTKKVCKYLNP